jgi:aminopeptidase N
MRTSTAFIVALLLLSVFEASAKHVARCSEGHIKKGIRQRGTLASPLELLYDVQHVKIDLAMTNISTAIAGSTTITSRVVEPAGMSQYAFELNDNLTIDSAKINGVAVAVASSGNHLRVITLGTPLAQNAVFSAQIFYRGTPASGSGFFNGGVINTASPAGTEITYTMSDDYFAKDWWPSKQVLQDKIDSADIWITVPVNVKAGSNGLLQRVTPVGSAFRYEWKTKYPIDYYLISAAVAPYIDYAQMVHFSNSTDSMLVQHYLYDTATFMPLYKSAIDSTPLMIDYFSTLFGRYPFWKEKYGHCIAPLSGGMEHQTMTTLGAFTTPLIAHELGHQWWGNHVTYSSWRDIWMSEGWASYCEQLFVEHFRGTAAAQAYRTNVFNRVIGSPGGIVYVNDTSSVGRTFDARLTYDKGAAVAHMLRFVAPSDSVYFAGLRNYQQQYAYKHATTEDFKAVMEAAYGQDLDSFFNQWVYKEGYPTIAIKWNQAGNTVLLRVSQASSRPRSVQVFHTPIEFRLSSAAGDTVIRVMSDRVVQDYTLTWNKAVTAIAIDPNNHILNRNGLVAKDPALAVQEVKTSSLRVYPNPGRDTWQVSGFPPAAKLILYNGNGQKVWEQQPTTDKATIPAAHLPAGLYELLVIAGGQTVARSKLLH